MFGEGLTMPGCIFRKAAVTGFSGMALLIFGISAQASSLVVNGSFETTTNGPGQLGDNTNATGWTTSGYNFLFAYGTGDNGGSNGSGGNLQLWGPNDGSDNGLPAGSPDGGNYVGADGAYEVGAITQTINGLTIGELYTVGFYWAGAQQSGFNGATTEQWDVSLGSQEQSTTVVDNASHGFTGWEFQSFTYTATSSSEVLSFLAVGTPTGVPPFVLLDGVSMAETSPEPGTWILMFGGLMAGLGFLRLKKRLMR
jgi:hypothetical protein